jgi:hypothetical protein
MKSLKGWYIAIECFVEMVLHCVVVRRASRLCKGNLTREEERFEGRKA